jgi:hypothetical protein
MGSETKRQYVKPRLTSHGSVEELTAWTGGGSGEFFGSSHGGKSGKIAFRKNGPGDFGS